MKTKSIGKIINNSIKKILVILTLDFHQCQIEIKIK